MGDHRHDDDLNELKTYFTSVIDWLSGVSSRAPDSRNGRSLET